LTKLGTTTLLSVGLATAAFAGVASAGEELSKKEFQKGANAICKVANEGIEAAFIAAGFSEETFSEDTGPTAEQIQAAVAGAAPIFRAALDEISALEGPSAYQKKVDKLLDQYNKVVDVVEEDPVSSFSEDGPDPFAKPNKQAKKLGLKQCVQ